MPTEIIRIFHLRSNLPVSLCDYWSYLPVYIYNCNFDITGIDWFEFQKLSERETWNWHSVKNKTKRNESGFLTLGSGRFNNSSINKNRAEITGWPPGIFLHVPKWQVLCIYYSILKGWYNFSRTLTNTVLAIRRKPIKSKLSEFKNWRQVI